MENAFTIRLVLFLIIFCNGILRSQGSQQSLCFKENKGQVSDQFYKSRPDVLFSGTDGKIQFHLKANGISYQLTQVDEWTKREARFGRKNNDNQIVPSKGTIYRIDINWLNANVSPEIKKGKTQQGYENYYLASCPEGALQVKCYSNLTYENLYPGIDLKWYEKNGTLEYDYYVAANSDYKKIQLEYKGAEKIFVDRNGTLIIKTPLGVIKEQKPLVIQNQRPLPAKWIVKDNIISFEIKGINNSLPLIIDPAVRLWATYYGGTLADDAYYTYADAVGNVFMSGGTLSTSNIATSGAHQTVFGGGITNNDAYLVKFNSAGIRQWATYYGGTGDDYGDESISDASGNVFLTGATSSTNTGVITTTGAHQVVYSSLSSNLSDAFLVMFNAQGVRQWGTYYGGDMEDIGYGVSLDNANNVYMCGGSHSSSNISTPGSHQPVLVGNIDAFLVKFNSSGVRQWGTYYGGNGTIDETSFDCVTNASGDTYINGVTSSTAGIATPGSYQPLLGGLLDAFFAKFNSSGVLQWGTYYGTNADETPYAMALDVTGNIYGSGGTSSTSGTLLATTGSQQTSPGGSDDAFLVKLDPSGARLWGTYYGGVGNEYGYSTSTDALGNVYLAGSTSSGTNSATKIATPCAYQSVYAGGTDAFLAKFSSSGARMWGSYYGGIHSDQGYGCSADASGNIYLCGFTNANSNTVISSSNGYQPAYGGGSSDAFLVKFDGCIPGSAPDLTPLPNLNVCAGTSATLSTSCGNWYNTSVGSSPLATGSTFTTGPLISDSTFYIEDFSCGSVTGTRTAVHLTLTPAPTLTLANSNPLACINEMVTLTASGASTYSWINNSATTPSIQFVVFLNTTYTVTGADANGCQSTATLAVVPNLCLGVNEPGNINSCLSVYPNPTNGAFTIQSGSNLNLTLTNELGQTLKILQLTSVNNFRLTLNDLPNGIYFLKGEKENHTLNKKIIVIH